MPQSVIFEFTYHEQWEAVEFLEIRKIHRKTPVPEFFNKETLVQVFFCEFWEISKNTFSYRIPPVAAREQWDK